MYSAVSGAADRPHASRQTACPPAVARRQETRPSVGSRYDRVSLNVWTTKEPEPFVAVSLTLYTVCLVVVCVPERLAVPAVFFNTALLGRVSDSVTSAPRLGRGVSTLSR